MRLSPVVIPVLAAAAALLIAAGCASSGMGLVAGVSTADEVAARMGQPAERLKAADGDTIWFYPNQPFGRTTHAVRVAPDGRVRSVEQVLTEANVAKIVAGQTTRSQVRELFGPPYQTSYLPRQQREVWTWAIWNIAQWEYYLHVQMSDDGIVREVLMLRDYRRDIGDPFFRF